jgi:cobalt-zinc-cadmium efflux system membrane fusion protein
MRISSEQSGARSLKWIEVMKKIATVMCLLSVAGALEAHGHSHDHDHEHEEFQWNLEKSAYADIQTEIAGPGIIQKFSQVSGKIIAHPDHFAYVIPKAGGTVFAIEKNLGDPVHKGDILAVIESKEAAEAKTHYLLAQKKAALQKELLRREEGLRGISAGNDYLEAKLASEEADLEYECALQALYNLGFSDTEIARVREESPLQRRFYTLKAPLGGKVLDRKLILGEHADEEIQAFTVGNFEKVWIEMHVPQDDVRYLKEGLEVKIASATGKEATVSVCQFSPTICEETRMAKAIAVMENPSEKWTPGQYVNASIRTKAFELPLVVPREAVQKVQGNDCLFVQNGDNFEPCKVKLGKMDEKYVEIVGGLYEGECYVSKNAFCLKAEFEKEEVEHNH